MLTKNEAQNVPRALRSVPLGARTLVVDAQSADETVALARDLGAEVFVRPWEGFVATRRFALAQIRTPWTFMLDADEALDARLVEALAALEPAAAADGFSVRRATYFCGRPIRGGSWGTDAPLRLFRTGRAALSARPAAGGEAELHERWTVPGAVTRLPGTLLHFSYPTLASYREKFDRYTSLEARGSPGGGVRFLRVAALSLPRAVWQMLGRGGWRDGWRGAYIACASAAYPAVVAWKAWQA